MLVRVAKISPHPPNSPQMPDCEITSTIGNVVACTGSMARRWRRWSVIRTLLASRVGYSTSGLELQGLDFIRARRSCSRTQASGKRLYGTFATIDEGIDVLHEAFLYANGDSRDNVDLGSDRQHGAALDPLPTRAAKPTERCIHPQISSATLKTVSWEKGLKRATKRILSSHGELSGGHGTHVTSIAAGRRVGKFAGGVAP